MSSDVIAVVRARKNFYRDYYRRILKMLMICMFIMVALIVAIFFMLVTRGEHDYYATSSNGSLTQINPAPWGSQFTQPDQGSVGTVSNDVTTD